MKLTFTEEDHTYKVDGRVVESVTRLISQAGRGVDYSAVPDFVLARARERGIHVDLACDLYDAGQLDWDTVHPQWAGYVEAWQKFRCDQPTLTIAETQARLYHPLLDYAGSSDVIAFGEGKMLMIDRKCSKEIHHDPYGLQLAAYAMPDIQVAHPETGELRPLGDIHHRWIVQLHGNGKYTLAAFEDDKDYDDWVATVRLARRAMRYQNGGKS